MRMKAKQKVAGKQIQIKGENWERRTRGREWQKATMERKEKDESKDDRKDIGKEEGENYLDRDKLDGEKRKKWR